ncbi:MAG: AAA family ATPase [Candidatus Hodarchaeota archaeon]
MIYLNRLYIENLKTFKNEYFDFVPGKNVITGPNGAGKSTILNSISYSLFGRFPSANLEDYVSTLTGETHFTVKLWFNIGGDEYIVERGWNGSSSAELWLLDSPMGNKVRPLAKNTKPVNQEIIKLLDVDRTESYNLFYAQQSGINSVISQDLSKRKKFLDKALTLERLGECINPLKRFVKHSKELIESKKETITDLSNETKDIDKLSKKINNMKTECTSLKDEIDAVGKNKDDLEEVITRQNEKHQAIIKEEGSLTTLVKNQKDENDKIPAKINLLKDLLKKIPEITKPSKYDEKNLEDMVTQLDGVKSKFKESSKGIIEKISTYNTFNKQIEEKEEELSSLARETKTLDQEIRGIRNGFSTPDFESRVDEFKIERDNFSGYVIELNSLSKNSKVYSKLSQSLEDIQKRLKKKSAKLDQSLNGDWEKLIEAYKNIEFEKLFKEHEKERERLIEEQNSIDREIASARTSINERNENISKLSENSGQCPTCLSKIDAMRQASIIKEHLSDIEENNKTIMELNSKMSTLEGRIKNQSNKIDKLTGKQTLLTKFESDYDDVIDSREKLGELDDLMKKLRRGLKDQKKEGKIPESITYENFDKQLSSFQTQISTLERNINEVEKLTRLTSNLVKYKEKKEKLEKKIKDLEDQRDKEDIEYLEKKEKEINTTIENTEKCKDETRNLKTLYDNIQVYEDKIEEKKKELEKIQKEYDGKKHLENKRKRDELERIISEMQTKLTIMKDEQLPDLEDRLKKKLAAKKRLEELETKIDMLGKKVGLSKKLQLIIAKYIRSLRRQKTSLISKEMTRFFLNFYRDSGFERVVLNEDYSLRVVRFGKEYDARELSGGEQTICGVAIRLAISKALLNIGLLILDEPTEALDNDNREELVNFFEQRFPVNQTIIVSHYDEMVGIADNHIELRFENGTSHRIKGD